MKLGDMPCPWHPGMTLFECQALHDTVTEPIATLRGDPDDDE